MGGASSARMLHLHRAFVAGFEQRIKPLPHGQIAST